MVAIAYMLITFLVLAGSLWIFPKIRPAWFSISDWTARKEFLLIGMNLLGISAGVFLFKVSFGFYEFTMERVLTGLLATVTIGILPTTIYKLASIAYAHLDIFPPTLTLDPSPPGRSLMFEAERGGHQLILDPDQIMTIEVQKNYLLFSYMNEGKVQTDRLRNRMYYAEKLLEQEPHLLRCHRAFMVNHRFVQEQHLNTHGGSLHLKGLDSTIPVSRKYASLFLDLETV